MIAIMSYELIQHLTTLPGSRLRQLLAGNFLFHQGDPVESLFIVEQGMIRLLRQHVDGSLIKLQQAYAQHILAEASLFSHCYHCAAYVEQQTAVWAIPKQAVIHLLNTQPQMNVQWIKYLTQQVQQARFRSELLCLRTVAARLDAWLNWYQLPIPNKGEWKGLAEQLGVSPEALYRELAKRQPKISD